MFKETASSGKSMPRTEAFELFVGWLGALQLEGLARFGRRRPELTLPRPLLRMPGGPLRYRPLEPPRPRLRIKGRAAIESEEAGDTVVGVFTVTVTFVVGSSRGGESEPRRRFLLLLFFFFFFFFFFSVRALDRSCRCPRATPQTN